jgi:hypothetical protein
MFYSVKTFTATILSYTMARIVVIFVSQHYLGIPFVINDILMSFEYLLLFIGSVTMYVRISKGYATFQDYALIKGSNKYLADLCNLIVFILSLLSVFAIMEIGFHSLIGADQTLMSAYMIAREVLAISLGLSLSWWLFLKKIYTYLSEEEAEIFFAEQGYDEKRSEEAIVAMMASGRIRPYNTY